jgi:hypothetical protein
MIWLANEHDLVAGYQLNKKWVEYDAPQQIGDKAYLQYRTTRVQAAPGGGKGHLKRPKHVSASVFSHRIA